MTKQTYFGILALWMVLTVVGTITGMGDSPSSAKPPAAEAESKSKGASNSAVERPGEPLPVGHPSLGSPHAAPIAISGDHVFVVNTPADTLDIIDRKSGEIAARVAVGIDPVSVAVHPDGKEVWVSNHVSDSVSVVDIDAQSPTYLNIVATIQDIDPKTKATRFDEPVGIAFANPDKAYVALSSENLIAVIDVPSRKVTGRLNIPAQDPRAIVVRGDRLYVIPFESNNQTQLSGGTGELDGDLVTFNAWEHSVANNNVLSLGHVVDIVKHPKVPDRDLFVFDTNSDELVATVETLGTLLYGLAVNSQGNVYIAQTDARNEANGRSGTKKHGLAELENRAFLNRITALSLTDDEAQAPRFFDLEPLPPQHPAPGKALATPFAIQVTSDDSTLVATAAGSDKLFTLDADSGELLGSVQVGAVPRGIALDSGNDGQAERAWVHNAVENSISLVDLANLKQPRVLKTIALEDPTHPTVKRGRIAFNTAAASTTETFACASCHPDGHTDQLLWVLKTPIVTGGNQIMPRSTMPIRGLRDTAPYHWDGIPGDPYGGNNSANIHGSDPPNSHVDDPTSTTRHLIDGGLAATMMLEGSGITNDEDKAGALSAAERDNMATFLLSVPYPPAQRRSYDNVVSPRAAEGFRLFHIDGDHDPKQPTPNVCGNCHRMPFLVSTNTPGTGMDTPTWRGAYDRFLILPQGRLNIIDFDFYRRVAERGAPERDIWQFSWSGRRRFDPVWDMVLEAGTGFSGSFARQTTLNGQTTGDEQTLDLIAALERSAAEGAIVLECDGVLQGDNGPQPYKLQFTPEYQGGRYVDTHVSRAVHIRKSFGRDELIELASAGQFIGTFTGRHGSNADVDHPQPAIWTLGPLEKQSGRQKFPILHPQQPNMTVSVRHLDEGAQIIVNGRRVDGTVTLDGDTAQVELTELPKPGLHLLQLQNPAGLLSNEFLFHVVESDNEAVDLQKQLDNDHVDHYSKITRAITRGNVERTAKLLDERVRASNESDRRRMFSINGRRQQTGATLLSTAALHDQLDSVKLLLDRGADANATNRDGNTPLHVATFLCRQEIVELLLANGASLEAKNGRSETPRDVVLAEWSKALADFYRGIGRSTGQELDLERIEKQRPQIAKFLKRHQETSGNSDD